ncbi:MAG: hypothetical protein SWX82_34820 [Cyanobacteriota bacterium]|nr:hypothetical protein [Cyanobacteriota bacterium]
MPLNIYRRDTHIIKAPEKLSSCEALREKSNHRKNFHPINSHVEAIAILTNQSNYHFVKLKKNDKAFPLASSKKLS